MLLGRSSGQVAELHEIRFEAASLMARIYAEQVALNISSYLFSVLTMFY